MRGCACCYAITPTNFAATLSPITARRDYSSVQRFRASGGALYHYFTPPMRRAWRHFSTPLRAAPLFRH